MDFIVVHHVNPLSTYVNKRVVNPKTDLVCVCANCHSMIHRHKNQVLSIDELKSIIEKNKH